LIEKMALWQVMLFLNHKRNCMDPTIRKFQVKRTAHVAELGNDISHAKQIWMVLHGYGQLANRIVRKFDHLNLDEIYAIAPEGLNKFYWHDAKREPVATWMTKHERDDEINNYLSYLDQVYDTLILPHLNHAKFNILGFSQGTATMWRWVMHRKPELSKLIQWAGEFPPEPPYKQHLDYLEGIDLKYLYGTNDKFINGPFGEKIFKQIDQQPFEMDVVKYDGTHRINREVLKSVI